MRGQVNHCMMLRLEVNILHVRDQGNPFHTTNWIRFELRMAVVAFMWGSPKEKNTNGKSFLLCANFQLVPSHGHILGQKVYYTLYLG